MIRLTLIIIIALYAGSPLSAQVIDTTRTAEDLVNNILLGSGVLVGNVKFQGEKHAIGIFRDSLKQTGIREGILLTSGNALFVSGPNKNPRSGWASDAPGDEELDAIARGKTYDAAVLEFDFVTTSENVSFQYVFASEEYLEYVGSKFNDVFAFFVEGPQMRKQNIAMLPDGITPITVNTVNNELNSQYYVDNTYVNTTDPFVWDVRNRKVIANKNYLHDEIPPKYNIQFDGFTTVLEARCIVVPNEVYHIKIAISDVGDGILDSGVILKGGSFQSYGKQSVPVDKLITKVITPKAAVSLKPTVGSIEITPRGIPLELKIGNIEFDFDKFSIPSKASGMLTDVINEWSKRPDGLIHIIGHTDNYGSDMYNINLSKHRSDAVATALIGLGIPQEKLVINYFGESHPIKSNLTDEGRARNRRVELIIRY